MDVYKSNQPGTSYKADESPITIADKIANQRITSILKKTGIPILSEEGAQVDYLERSQWKRFWLIDPLDGTKEFIKRNGEFTVNIALIENNQPILGVVYAPVPDECWFGSKSAGSFKVSNCIEGNSSGTLSPKRIKCNARKIPYTVVGSRSHSTSETEEFIKVLQSQHGELVFESKGSSLKICMVAEGLANIYPRFAPTMEWDTAAGHAVAEASGCRIYDPNTDRSLVYNKKNLLNPWFVVEAQS